MANPTSRVLALLELLQTHRHLSGGELATNSSAPTSSSPSATASLS